MRISGEAVWQNGKDVEQVTLDIEIISLGSINQAVSNCVGLSTFRRIAKEPVFSADHQGADGIFNLVVAQFDFAVIQEGTKIRLLVDSIGHSLLQFAGGLEQRVQPGIVFFHNRLGTGLPLLLSFLIGQCLQLLLDLEKSAAVLKADSGLAVFLRGILRHGLVPLSPHVRQQPARIT